MLKLFWNEFDRIDYRQSTLNCQFQHLSLTITMRKSSHSIGHRVLWSSKASVALCCSAIERSELCARDGVNLEFAPIQVGPVPWISSVPHLSRVIRCDSPMSSSAFTPVYRIPVSSMMCFGTEPRPVLRFLVLTVPIVWGIFAASLHYVAWKS